MNKLRLHNDTVEITPQLVKDIFDAWVIEGLGFSISPTSKYVQPEFIPDETIREIVAGVLIYAIKDYLRLKIFTTFGIPNSSRYYKEEAGWAGDAEAWIYNSKSPRNELDIFMGFDNVCLMLGWNPDNLRDCLDNIRAAEAKKYLRRLNNSLISKVAS